MNADHIQDPNDWAILFALLECSGAGAKPPPIVNPDTHLEEPSEHGWLSKMHAFGKSSLYWGSGHAL